MSSLLKSVNAAKLSTFPQPPESEQQYNSSQAPPSTQYHFSAFQAMDNSQTDLPRRHTISTESSGVLQPPNVPTRRPINEHARNNSDSDSDDNLAQTQPSLQHAKGRHPPPLGFNRPNRRAPPIVKPLPPRAASRRASLASSPMSSTGQSCFSNTPKSFQSEGNGSVNVAPPRNRLNPLRQSAPLLARPVDRNSVDEIVLSQSSNDSPKEQEFTAIPVTRRAVRVPSYDEFQFEDVTPSSTSEAAAKGASHTASGSTVTDYETPIHGGENAERMKYVAETVSPNARPPPPPPDHSHDASHENQHQTAQRLFEGRPPPVPTSRPPAATPAVERTRTPYHNSSPSASRETLNPSVSREQPQYSPKFQARTRARSYSTPLNSTRIPSSSPRRAGAPFPGASKVQPTTVSTRTKVLLGGAVAIGTVLLAVVVGKCVSFVMRSSAVSPPPPSAVVPKASPESDLTFRLPAHFGESMSSKASRLAKEAMVRANAQHVQREVQLQEIATVVKQNSVSRVDIRDEVILHIKSLLHKPFLSGDLGRM